MIISKIDTVIDELAWTMLALLKHKFYKSEKYQISNRNIDN